VNERGLPVSESRFTIETKRERGKKWLHKKRGRKVVEEEKALHKKKRMGGGSENMKFSRKRKHRKEGSNRRDGP